MGTEPEPPNEPPSDPRATAWVYLDIDDPLVAWNVYRGQLFSADRVAQDALSIWHTRNLREVVTDPQTRAAAYRGEIAIESARVSRHPDCGSRLQGFYVFPDRNTALRASETWDGRGFAPDKLEEIGILPNSRVSRYDAQWISHHLTSGDGPWIDQYLAGAPASEAPTWEWIVQGKADIYGTELRERARDRVLAEWPNSRSILEIARQAAWLDSDLGLSVARAQRIPGGISIEHWMQWADATNETYLDRLDELKRDRPDLIDWESLGDPTDPDPSRPDLRKWNFVISLDEPEDPREE
jgi:hypothetical protein